MFELRQKTIQDIHDRLMVKLGQIMALYKQPVEGILLNYGGKV
jgi:hypothetical protein